MVQKPLLRSWRIANGLSQAALARLLGTSQTTIFNYEAGRDSPDPRMRAKLFRLTDRIGPFAVSVKDMQETWEQVRRKDMEKVDREVDAAVKLFRSLKNGKQTDPAEAQARKGKKAEGRKA